jgi:flagellar hook-associated protein 3 FlgL
MTTRVGDFAQNYRLNDNVQMMRTRLASHQVDVATGKSPRNYADIASEASLLINSKEQREITGNFIVQNQQVIDRMTAMEGSLGSISDLAERFRNVILQAVDDSSGSSVPLEAEADSMREELASLLNRQMDGRYLFSGSRTDQQPVVLPATTITTIDPTLYYEGDEIVLSLRADADVEIDYGITADETAFARLFGALGSATEAHNNLDKAGLEASLQQVTEAIDEIADLRGRLGSRAARTEAVTEGQRASMNYLDETISRIEDTNLPETITAIANDQANLEATYATITRINQLSLADYLR